MADLNTLTPENVFVGFKTDADWATFWEAITYQGFDPMETFKTLIEAASKTAPPTTKDQFAKDMFKIVSLYVKRGSNFKSQKFKDRSTKDGFAAIEKLMAIYGINANLTEKGSGPKVVTIARVVILFVEIAVALYAVGLARPIVTDEKGILPNMFCFPSSPSIMSDDEWKLYKDNYLDVMVKFSRVINRRRAGDAAAADNNARKIAEDNQKMDDASLRAMQETYAENARNSAFSRGYRKQKRMMCNLIQKELIDTYKLPGPATLLV